MYECDSGWCVCTDTWALEKRLKNKGMRQKQTWRTRPRVIRAPQTTVAYVENVIYTWVKV